MRRGAGAIASLALVLVACMPVVAPAPPGAEPGEPIGPELVIDVVNRSNREVRIGYEFEAPNSAGGGEGLMPPCERMMSPFGGVGGRFEILVDGDVVMAEVMPPGMPADGFVLVRVTIEPDGEVEVAPQPAWMRLPPDLVNQRLPDCG